MSRDFVQFLQLRLTTVFFCDCDASAILDSLAPFAKLVASFIFFLMVVVATHILFSCSSETDLDSLAILIRSSLVLLNVFFILLWWWLIVLLQFLFVSRFFFACSLSCSNIETNDLYALGHWDRRWTKDSKKRRVNVNGFVSGIVDPLSRLWEVPSNQLRFEL